MSADPAAARLYGPLWPVLSDVLSLLPHTDAPGIATLVALCAPTDPVHITELRSLIRRPRPGGRSSATRYMAELMPSCADKTLPFEADQEAIDWVAEDPGRRIWAVSGLVWGLDLSRIVRSFDELSSMGGRSRPFTLDDVVALATATPRQIPGHLQRQRSLDDWCTALAGDVGVSPSASFEVTLPAAMGAIAVAIAGDPPNGLAAAALAIRAGGHPGLTPAGLITSTRPGTAAHNIASILAGLWRTTLHEDADSGH